MLADLKRDSATFPFETKDLKIIKQKMLNWASRFGIFLFLDSNEYRAQGGVYECLLGAGAATMIKPNEANLFDELHAFYQLKKDWLFGHICYDVKNLLEPTLSSEHQSQHAFPQLQFFVPEVVIGILAGSNELFIEARSASPEAIYQQIIEQKIASGFIPKITFQQRIAQADYLLKIEALRNHIFDGDCYEINFCTEGFCEVVDVDALSVFNKLNAASPAPFAACYRLDDQYLMCASPERYLRKEGTKIVSQPIKGTARRSKDAAEDEALKSALFNSEKERAENVMIVDLMRNDLARSCAVGSIHVDELFGIYTFPQVHQMISTVSGTLRNDQTFVDVLRHSFPMGSMTGAPKVKVMELIEKYETARRGLFAGTVGYISPDGDFDFNVVIRSLFYNAISQYLSYQTGGAITWDSDAQSEWEEMRLKASAMERIFE